LAVLLRVNRKTTNLAQMVNVKLRYIIHNHIFHSYDETPVYRARFWVGGGVVSQSGPRGQSVRFAHRSPTPPHPPQASDRLCRVAVYRVTARRVTRIPSVAVVRSPRVSKVFLLFSNCGRASKVFPIVFKKLRGGKINFGKYLKSFFENYFLASFVCIF
jgi:hypothetical protein